MVIEYFAYLQYFSLSLCDFLSNSSQSTSPFTCLLKLEREREWKKTHAYIKNYIQLNNLKIGIWSWLKWNNLDLSKNWLYDV